MESSLAKFKAGAGSFQSVIAELVTAVDVERKQLEESRRRLEEERQAWEQERKVGGKGVSSLAQQGPRPSRRPSQLSTYPRCRTKQNPHASVLAPQPHRPLSPPQQLHPFTSGTPLHPPPQRLPRPHSTHPL